ncbi:MAG: hypothetical protein WEA24_09550, partial [Gemmatimonadota bacterium]
MTRNSLHAPGAVLALSALLGLGCDSEPVDRVDAGVPDSLRLTVHLVAEIGETRSGRDYEFAAINDVLVTRGGEVWVSDGGRARVVQGAEPMVRIYSASGEFVRQVGREGAGPGEYRIPSGMAELPDGRVIVRDGELADRLTLYQNDGQFDDIWTLDARRTWVTGSAPGAILADSSGVVYLRYFGSRRPGQLRSIWLLRIVEGTTLDSIRIPEPSRPAVDDVAWVRREACENSVGPPFGPFEVTAWSAGRFARACTGEYRIGIVPIEAAGKPWPDTLVIERPAEPVLMQPEVHAQTREEFAKMSGLERSPTLPREKPILRPGGMWFGHDRSMVVGVHMPSVRTDAGWTEPWGYDLFSADGAYQGRFVLPEDFMFRGLRGDLVWGIIRDEFGVHTVRV